MAKVTKGREAIHKAVQFDYEVRGLGIRRLEALHGIPKATIAYWAKDKGWVRGSKQAAPSAMEEAILNVGLKDDGTVPETDENPASFEVFPNADARSKNFQAQTNVLHFPGAKLPQVPERDSATQILMLPDETPPDPNQIKVTLGAIRSMMTLQQVHALDQHEGLLRRYGHLLHCYLDPESVTDVHGLTAFKAAEKVNATQVLAMRQLLPTERDTLAGAIKILTDSLHRTMQLKRTMIGIISPKVGASRVGELDPEAEPEKATGTDGVPVAVPVGVMAADLGTGELRLVSQAMELLQRRHQSNREAPKPPPPDSIDDLMDPDPDEELPR